MPDPGDHDAPIQLSTMGEIRKPRRKSAQHSTAHPMLAVGTMNRGATVFVNALTAGAPRLADRFAERGSSTLKLAGSVLALAKVVLDCVEHAPRIRQCATTGCAHWCPARPDWPRCPRRPHDHQRIRPTSRSRRGGHHARQRALAAAGLRLAERSSPTANFSERLALAKVAA